jgi:hypothetical protein
MKSCVFHGFTDRSVGNHCSNIPYSRPTKSGELSDKRGEEEGEKEGRVEVQLIPGQGRLENRMIEKKKRVGRKKVKVEM